MVDKHDADGNPVLDKAVDKGKLGSRVFAGFGITSVVVLLIVLGQMSGGLEFLNNSANKYKTSAIEEVAHENEHTALRQDTQQNTDFRKCWPLGTCVGYQQLPVDGVQNADIERLKEQTSAVYQFIRRLCQTLRDGGDRDYDCSRL